MPATTGERCERCGQPPFAYEVDLLSDDRGTVWGWSPGCECPPLCTWCEARDARSDEDHCSDACADAEERWFEHLAAWEQRLAGELTDDDRGAASAPTRVSSPSKRPCVSPT